MTGTWAPPKTTPRHVHLRALLPKLFAGQLVRLENGDDPLHARRRFDLLDLFGRLLPDRSDHGPLHALGQVDVEAEVPEPFDHLLDHFVGRARLHDHDHAPTSPFVAAASRTAASASIKRWFCSGVPMLMRSAVGQPKELPALTMTPALQEAPVHLVAGPAEVDPDEVGLRRVGPQAQRLELLRQPLAFGPVDPAAHLDVFGVLQRGDGRGLGHPVDVERRAHPLQRLDDVDGPHGVADPQAREAVDLGEGAGRDHPPAFPDELQHVREIGSLDILHVRLVEHHQRLPGDRVQEAEDLCPGDVGAGGVVGIADEDKAGPVLAGPVRHLPEVVDPFFQRDAHFFRVHQAGDEGVLAEGGLGEDGAPSRFQVRLGQHPEDLVRAAAHRNLPGVDVQVPSQRLPQRSRGAVGVQVDLAGGPSRGFPGQAARAVRVFVRRKLNRVVDAEEATRVLGRCPGDVRLDPFKRPPRWACHWHSPLKRRRPNRA